MHALDQAPDSLQLAHQVWHVDVHLDVQLSCYLFCSILRIKEYTTLHLLLEPFHFLFKLEERHFDLSDPLLIDDEIHIILRIFFVLHC